MDPVNRSRAPLGTNAWHADEFGNKTANLGELAQLLDGKVRVPPFVGISHAQVREFLGPRCRLALDELSGVLRRESAHGVAALTPAMKDALRDVRQAIAVAFANRDGLPGGEALATFLQRSNGAPLMVRSTGHEDNDTLANAGGNASVANVQPTPEALKLAMATVLTSYFGDKSYAQRLLAGDDVAQPAFVPLLVQQMVGEQAAGYVPSSGVLFTQEMEGPTPGVAQIHSTFGHNEAVVSNLLPVDSFLVDARAVHKRVRRKPQRLSPNDAGGLRRTDNAGATRLLPAISDAVARRLAAVGETISQHYGRPMDIEWTYDRNDGTLYLLQARPLVGGDGAAPSHLAPSALARAPTLTTEVVGAAGGSVRFIATAEGCLMAETLPQALQAFLARPAVDQDPRRGVAAVVVAQQAEATSHEATTFRGVGLPVLRVDDLAAARAFVAAQAPLLLDTGSGKWVGASTLLEADGATPRPGVVVAGWGEHPLPARLSTTLGLVGGAAAAALPGFVTAACAALQLPRTALPAPADLALAQLLQRPEAQAAGLGLRGLLARWQQAPSAALQAGCALGVLRQAVVLTERLQREPSLRRRSQGVLQQTLLHVCQAQAAAHLGPDHVSFLFQLNWLSATLLQGAADDAVAGDSLAGLAAEFKELQALRTQVDAAELATPERATYALLGRRLASLALRDDVGGRWQQFCAALAASDAGQQVLAALVVQLQDQDIAPTWINTLFAQAAAKGEGDALALGQALLAQLTPAPASPATAWFADVQDFVAQARSQLAAWADPEALPALLPSFVATVQQTLRDAGPAAYVAATPAERLRLLAGLRQSVDVFDQTIKAVTGAPNLPVGQKVATFGALLTPYAQLMVPWLRAAAPTFAKQTANYLSAEAFASYLAEEAAQRVYQLSFRYGQNGALLPKAAAELHVTPGFNVAAAQLGSCAAPDQHQPTTLEEYFTAVHQSLLQVVAAAGLELGLGPDALGKTARSFALALHRPVADAASRTPAHAFSPQLIGMTFDARRTDVRFNVPMREHSMVLQLTQARATPHEVQLTTTVFSERDENYRNCRAMLAAGLLAMQPGVRLDDAVPMGWDLGAKQTRWAWRIDVQAGRANGDNLDHGNNADALAERCFACLRYVTLTSFNERADDVTLMGILHHAQAYLPDLPATLGQLPVAFFVQMPWYNDQFFTYYVENDRTDAPAFANLLEAINFADPREQDRLWTAHVLFEDRPHPPSRPTAPALAQAWRASHDATPVAAKPAVAAAAADVGALPGRAASAAPGAKPPRTASLRPLDVFAESMFYDFNDEEAWVSPTTPTFAAPPTSLPQPPQPPSSEPAVDLQQAAGVAFASPSKPLPSARSALRDNLRALGVRDPAAGVVVAEAALAAAQPRRRAAGTTAATATVATTASLAGLAVGSLRS